ncbi:hypothetical protein ACP0HM_11590 [Escherichia coli]
MLNRCMAKWTIPGLAGNSVWVTGGRTTNRGCVKRLVWKVKKTARLVLLATKSAAWWFAGRMSAEEGQKVALWAQTLGWPLIGDVLSQTGQPLPCADLWLGNAKATSELQQAQIVVQLGSSLTGKRLLQWQASCEPEEYWIVDDIEGRLDPAHHRGRRLIANIADWLELHPAEKNASHGALKSRARRNRQCRRLLTVAMRLAKRNWRIASATICLNRGNCLSVTARWYV